MRSGPVQIFGMEVGKPEQAHLEERPRLIEPPCSDFLGAKHDLTYTHRTELLMNAIVPFSGASILRLTEPNIQNTEAFDILSSVLAARYVRRETRFYNVDRPSGALSRRDVEQTFLNQAQQLVPNTPITPELMKRVFNYCIDIKHTDRTKSIPVWDGEMVCQPGNRNRVVWLETGSTTTLEMVMMSYSWWTCIQEAFCRCPAKDMLHGG